jgi:hypothetical protein
LQEIEGYDLCDIYIYIYCGVLRQFEKKNECL